MIVDAQRNRTINDFDVFRVYNYHVPVYTHLVIHMNSSVGNIHQLLFGIIADAHELGDRYFIHLFFTIFMSIGVYMFEFSGGQPSMIFHLPTRMRQVYSPH